LALSSRRSILLALGYLSVGGALLVVLTAVSQISNRHDVAPFANLASYIEFLAITSAVPLVVLWLLGANRVRAISSLVLTALLFVAYAYGVTGILFVGAAQRNDLANLVVAIGPTAARRILFIALAIPASALGWSVLRRLADGFERRTFSDVQLLADAWWLV